MKLVIRKCLLEYFCVVYYSIKKIVLLLPLGRLKIRRNNFWLKVNWFRYYKVTNKWTKTQNILRQAIEDVSFLNKTKNEIILSTKQYCLSHTD